MCIAFVGLMSCSKDIDSPSDDSAAVAGVYTGQLMYGTEVTEDAYVVSVTKISSNVVSVHADFFDGSVNFNVQKTASGYNLVSSTVYNIQITVYGNMMTINYTTTGGYMLTFQGKRD
jgi:rhs element vgr protein